MIAPTQSEIPLPSQSSYPVFQTFPNQINSGSTMKHTRLLGLAAASVMSLASHVVHGQSQATLESPSAATAIPPFAVCSRNVNIASLLPGGAHEDPDVVTAAAFITLTEQTLLQEVAQASSLDQYHQITLLGKTEIYDVNLSPLKNIACATCHVPYTGFRGERASSMQPPPLSLEGLRSPTPLRLHRTTASVPEILRAMPTLLSPQSFTTTRRKIVSMGATFGICAPPEFGSPIQQRNRHKDRPRIRWRWEILTLHA